MLLHQPWVGVGGGILRTSPQTRNILEAHAVDIPNLFANCFVISCHQSLWQLSARHDKRDTGSREIT